jgi:hypothetical protein
MAAFQAAVNAMPTAWLLAGQAIRVAQDLGLHVSLSLSPLGRRLIAASQPGQDELCRETASGEVLVGYLRARAVRFTKSRELMTEWYPLL